MKPVRIAILSLALAWICVVFVYSVVAQSRPSDFQHQIDQSVKIERNAVQIQDLERRVTDFEALKLSDRMARQEIIVENAYRLLQALLVGLAGLLVEAAYRIVRRVRGFDRRAPS